MVEDIIFLGAGASRADGAPLQAHLFREYFKRCKLEGGKNSGQKTLYGRIRKFFKSFFGIDVDRDDLKASHDPSI